jgi:hypothetical protein
MLWFWLNVPLAVAFFGAMCGIPLVKVLRNPSWGSQRVVTPRVQPAVQGPAGGLYHSEPRVDALALAGAQR